MPKATIELKLANYNGTVSTEKYGDEIVLQRTIRRSGSSTMKVQTANGEKVILKKGELNLILRPLQIHVNNEFQFLTQDNAPKFLKNATPSTLYELTFILCMQKK